MPDWVTLMTQAGVAGVLAAWVYVTREQQKQEREERLRVQAANDKLREAQQERLLTALNDASFAIKEGSQTQQSLKLVIEGLKSLMQSEFNKR